MTTIVGIVHEGAAYIGADSQVSTGWRKVISATPKVFRAGKFIIASCGDVRFADILRNHFCPGGQVDVLADRDYIVTVVVEHIRQRCKDLGYSRVSLNREDVDGNFLLAYKNRIYDVAGDYSVVTVEPNAEGDELYASGSGSAYALGALAALPHLRPTERLERAIAIASTFDMGSSGEATVLSSVVTTATYDVGSSGEAQ